MEFPVMKNQAFRKRLGFALTGLRFAFTNEKSFRIQLSIAVLAYAALGILGATPLWWAIITLCISLVLSAEVFNTALEQFIDHIHPARHNLIGLAKDCAAGAVLIASILSIVVFAFYLADRFA